MYPNVPETDEGQLLHRYLEFYDIPNGRLASKEREDLQRCLGTKLKPLEPKQLHIVRG